MGLEVVKYPYFDPDSGTVNFDTLLDLVSQARPQNTFILQACCHNLLGIDLIQNQWQTLAVAMKKLNVQYIGLLVYLVCIFGYAIYFRTRRVDALGEDLVTGVATEPADEAIARQKAEREEQNATKPAFIRIGKKYLSMLF
jgi:amino acid permease